MTKYAKTLIGLLIVSALAIPMASPGFAYSRSATVKISCTILPVLEISSPAVYRSPQLTSLASSLELISKGSSINVNSNLAEKYQVAEELVMRGNTPSYLYSVTAL